MRAIAPCISRSLEAISCLKCLYNGPVALLSLGSTDRVSSLPPSICCMSFSNLILACDTIFGDSGRSDNRDDNGVRNDIRRSFSPPFVPYRQHYVTLFCHVATCYDVCA